MEVILNQDGVVCICKQVFSRIVKIVTHCGRYTSLKIFGRKKTGRWPGLGVTVH